MASEIAPCLSLIFSASLYQGAVPQNWNLALVTPLFKRAVEKIHQTAGQFPSPAFVVNSWNMLSILVSCLT